MNMFDTIRAWADSKRLTQDETFEFRFAKLMTSMDGVMLGAVQHDREQAIAGIGKVMIELTLLAMHYGLPVEDALIETWNKSYANGGHRIVAPESSF